MLPRPVEQVTVLDMMIQHVNFPMCLQAKTLHLIHFNAPSALEVGAASFFLLHISVEGINSGDVAG